MWYPRHMLQARVGLFWGGATLAGAFSGLLAFGISFMDGVAGRAGWSWIFVRVFSAYVEGRRCDRLDRFWRGWLQLSLGSSRSSVSPVAQMCSRGTRVVCTWLTPLHCTSSVRFPGHRRLLDSRRARVRHPPEKCARSPREPSATGTDSDARGAEYDNSSVGEEERFSARHVRDALLDWQVWMLSLINMSVITPGARASLFAPCSSRLTACAVYGISLFLPYVPLKFSGELLAHTRIC